MFSLKNFRAADVKNDVLAGFVVAVSMIPEAVGFSLVVCATNIVCISMCKLGLNSIRSIAHLF